MTAHRIDRLLEDGRLEEVEPDPGAVVGHWEKALERWRVCQTGDLPRDTAFQVVYTAGFQLATAVLQAGGYRARGGTGGGHHWSTFYALRGLEHEKIDAIGVTLDASRSLRHDAIYEPTGHVSADDMKELADAVEALFGLAHDYLRERLPEVEDELALP